MLRNFLKAHRKADLTSRAAPRGGKSEQRERSVCSVEFLLLAGPKCPLECVVKAHPPS